MYGDTLMFTLRMNMHFVLEFVNWLRHFLSMPKDSNLPPVLAQDLWVYRATVLILGLAGLLSVIFGIWVTSKYGKHSNPFQYDDALISIGATSVGALAGLLAPSPKQSAPPAKT
jgi:hypothetical protein